jgi:L-threonylcarbamoyladenylate synthase
VDVAEAAAALRAGEVVGFPTDTVYGLAASAFDLGAAARIYEIKGRPAGMPLILMVASPAEVERWALVDARARALMERWWPGGLTLVLRTPDRSTLGIRIPDHPLALDLLRAAGPLLTTSANRHGEPPAMTAAEAAALPGLAGVLDGGRAPGALPSTLLDLTEEEPRVLREGAVPASELLR